MAEREHAPCEGRTAARQCARTQQHERCLRCDIHHKTALALLRAYDTIAVEAIAAAHVSRRPEPKPDENGTGTDGSAHHGAERTAGLNTSRHDAGWHHFRSILASTPACAGKRVDAVPPASPSQDCSGRGKRIPDPCAYARMCVRTAA